MPENEQAKPRRVRLSTVRVDVENAFDRLHVMLDMVDAPTQTASEAKARVMAYLDQRERDDVRERAALIACQTIAKADSERSQGRYWQAADLIIEAAGQARAALDDDQTDEWRETQRAAAKAEREAFHERLDRINSKPTPE